MGHTFGSPKGYICVITGGMCAGKTKKLQEFAQRALIARKEILVFKPIVDDRYSTTEVVTHDNQKLASILVRDSQELLNAVESTRAGALDEVFISEGQFFDLGLVEACVKLAGMDLGVYVEGLDMDSDGKPFGSMPFLMAVAEQVIKLHAVCVVCGEDASFSLFVAGNKKGQVHVGGPKEYEPRCRACYLSHKEMNIGDWSPVRPKLARVESG